jgi:hypothetical protein
MNVYNSDNTVSANTSEMSANDAATRLSLLVLNIIQIDKGIETERLKTKVM